MEMACLIFMFAQFPITLLQTQMIHILILQILTTNYILIMAMELSLKKQKSGGWIFPAITRKPFFLITIKTAISICFCFSILFIKQIITAILRQEKNTV